MPSLCYAIVLFIPVTPTQLSAASKPAPHTAGGQKKEKGGSQGLGFKPSKLPPSGTVTAVKFSLRTIQAPSELWKLGCLPDYTRQALASLCSLRMLRIVGQPWVGQELVAAGDLRDASGARIVADTIPSSFMLLLHLLISSHARY
jgi:hypothetical protein